MKKIYSPLFASFSLLILPASIFFGGTFHSNIYTTKANGVSSGLANSNSFSLHRSEIPTNDDFATPQVISPDSPFTMTLDTSSATTVAGDPVSSCQPDLPNNSVWFSYTPSSSQIVMLDSLDSTYDTVISVWTGSPGSLAEIGCNDDYSDGLQSKMQFVAETSTTYYIEITSVSGGGSLTLHASEPANDEIASSQPISLATSFTISQDTSKATTASDDPVSACKTGKLNKSVWFSYTPSAPQLVKLDTIGSSYDTVLSVWTGSAGSLAEVKCNDDTSGSQSKLQFVAETSTTYYIEVTSVTSGGGSLTLNASEPANDNIASPQPINLATPFTISQDTSNATTAGDDPVSSCKTGKLNNSVWFSYTPSAPQLVKLDTIGSSYDTVISVWTGNAGSLVEVECNDDTGGSQSKLQFVADSGTSYYIEVASVSSGGGSLTLNASEPANDNFASPQQVTFESLYTVIQDTSNATTAGNDPVSSCKTGQLNKSVWFSYTPASAQTIILDTSGSDYDTLISVWTGSIGSLVQIGCNDNDTDVVHSKLQFAAEASTTYYFEVASVTSGGGTLTLSASELASNDDFDSPKLINLASSYSNTQYINNATTAVDDPYVGCGPMVINRGLNSIWYSFTPTEDGVITADTFLSDYDTVLSLWKGTRGDLTSLACIDDYDIYARTSRIQAFVEKDTQYFLEITRFTETADMALASGMLGENQAFSKEITTSALEGTLILNAEFSNTSPNGPLFTTIDNQSNSGSGLGDGDLDAPIHFYNPNHPIEFTINVPDISSLSTAYLLLHTFDVDTGCGEIEKVYFNDNFIGNLSGSNEIWYTAKLSLIPTWVKLGINTVKIEVPNLVCPSEPGNHKFMAKVDWGQLVLNEQTGKTASNRTITLDQAKYRPGNTMHVNVEVDTSISSQNVWTEINLLSPTGVILTGTVREHAVTGSATDPISVDLSIPVTAGVGKYKIQVMVYDKTDDAVQDVDEKSFDLIVSKSFASVGSQDGWILETSETSTKGGTPNTSATTLRVGDSVGDKQYRGFLSFSTATGLPDNAVIVSATLRIMKQSLVGTNPIVPLKGLKFDMRKGYFGTSSQLLASDFQAAPSLSLAGSFGNTAVNNWYSATLSAKALSYIYKTGTTGLTQFRIRFAKDDNDNNRNDYFNFYSGNIGILSYRPTLIVEYYIP